MAKKKFLRTDWYKYSKLGRRRKKKQKYRRAKGRDNKIRLKLKSRRRNVEIGYKKEAKTRGLIKGLKPVRVVNIEELKKLKEGEIAILGRVGKKKKIEISKYSIENNIKFANFNPKKFLKELEKENES